MSVCPPQRQESGGTEMGYSYVVMFVLMAARTRVYARQSWSRQSHAFHSGYPWAQNRPPHAQQIRRASHRRHRRPGSQTNCENQARSGACRSGIGLALSELRPCRPIANLLHPPSWYGSRERRGNTRRSCSYPERLARTPKGPFSTAWWLSHWLDRGILSECPCANGSAFGGSIAGRRICDGAY